MPADFDAATVAAIDGRLDGIVRDDHANILLAIESGSRAWGFPSPDSDYDCRFFFVRREDDYLTPWPRRDVIDTPLDGDLDVNGWELGKALTRELGETPLPDAVERFIDSEFAIAEARPAKRMSLSADAEAAAETLFRKWVRA